MKKFFAFAIALVAMATSMVSCNNDNAEFIEQKAPTSTTVQKENPQEMKDICLLVAATAEQTNYFDEVFTIQVAGETKTVKVSEMEPATKEQIAAFSQTKEMEKAFDEDDERVDLVYYSVKLDKVNNFYSTKIMSRKLEVVANHPTDEFNFMNAACLYYNGQIVTFNTKLDVRYFKGVHGEESELMGFAEVHNQYN